MLFVEAAIFVCSVVIKMKMVALIFDLPVNLFRHRPGHLTKKYSLTGFGIYEDFTVGNNRLAITLWVPVWSFPFWKSFSVNISIG